MQWAIRESKESTHGWAEPNDLTHSLFGQVQLWFYLSEFDWLIKTGCSRDSRNSFWCMKIRVLPQEWSLIYSSLFMLPGTEVVMTQMLRSKFLLQASACFFPQPHLSQWRSQKPKTIMPNLKKGTWATGVKEGRFWFELVFRSLLVVKFGWKQSFSQQFIHFKFLTSFSLRQVLSFSQSSWQLISPNLTAWSWRIALICI